MRERMLKALHSHTTGIVIASGLFHVTSQGDSETKRALLNSLLLDVNSRASIENVLMVAKASEGAPLHLVLTDAYTQIAKNFEVLVSLDKPDRPHLKVVKKGTKVDDKLRR